MKITTPFYIEKRKNENHIDLCGKWDFTYFPEKTDNVESIDFRYSATLPKAVYWNVYEAGILPHPYEAANSKLYRNLDENAWYYKRKFTVDRAIDSDTENAFLCFDGVGYYSRVWLNGELLGDHEGLFGGPVCDVADRLKKGENEIIVEVTAHNYGYTPEEKEYNSKHYYDRCPAIVPWNVAGDAATSNGDFVTFGIWREIRIEIMPKKHIARPYLYTKSIDGNNAVMGLEVNIATEKIRELDVVMTAGEYYTFCYPYYNGLSGILSGESVNISVKIFDENKTVFEETEKYDLYDYDKCGVADEMRDLQIYRRDINLSDIQLWYPQGLGEPKLYNVEIKLSVGDIVLDTLDFKTGIRIIEHLDSAGRKYRQRWDKFHMCVNGKKIFLKGMNWMPTDFLFDENAEDTTWALELAKNQGLQLIRIWSGGGKPESDLFYEYCDENGIMLWQDAFLANRNSPQWNNEILENQICYYLYRLRNHPCLAVHCGGNEQRAYHFDNNAAQYIIQRNVEDLDWTRKYVRATPDKGSMHTYNDMEPVWFRKRYGDLPFMGECGIHSFPNAKSLRQLINNKEYTTPLDNIMDESFRTDFPELLNHFSEYHPERVPRMMARASHISDINGITLEGLCDATGMASHEFYQLLCQSLREAYPRCVGLMPWVFKRAWTTTAIQMVDGLGEPVAPYYSVKNSYSSVLCYASLCEVDYAPGETVQIPVKVINESYSAVNGTVTLDIFSPNLEKCESKSCPVSIDKDMYHTDVMTVDFTVKEEWKDKYFFVRTTLRDGDTYISSSLYPLASLSAFSDEEYRSNFRSEMQGNLIFENGPFQRTQIEESAKATLSAEIISNKREGDYITTELILRCENAPAYPVKLEVAEDKTLSYHSDSFFFMDKGESRKIKVVTRNKGDLDRKLTLCISAWNAEKLTLEI
ncbi:MAG: hypothetical protein IKU43_06230 [Clostridia bacterium]|nr:hypothetical protein [Clostridia bacterium]